MVTPTIPIGVEDITITPNHRRVSRHCSVRVLRN